MAPCISCVQTWCVLVNMLLCVVQMLKFKLKKITTATIDLNLKMPYAVVVE